MPEARAVTIASALGTTSAYTWLKMPACDDPDVVYGSTTLPCVVLGGVPGPDLAAQVASWGKTLRQDVVRGLHFQHPKAQGRLVMVTRGAAWDVVVDVRRGSPTFGRHLAVELNERIL